MCPIETPEGPNIGLIGALVHLRPGERVRLHRVAVPQGRQRPGHRRDRLHGRRRGGGVRRRPGQRAAERRRHVHARRRSSCAARRRPPSLADLKLQLERDVFFGATTDIGYVPPDEVHFMDVSPKQIVSVATALIPFLEHDDANRALMGANMQRQAVPLVRAEAPYIGTGIEARAARDAADMVLAEDDGTVTEVSGDSITVEYKTQGTQGPPARQVPPVEPGHLHQPEAPRARGPDRCTRATSWPTAPPPTWASWRWARTCSSPSCRGRATTSRTPSSCPSGS